MNMSICLLAVLVVVILGSNVSLGSQYTQCTLPSHTNGIITWPKGKTTFKLNSKVWYSCKDGYVLDSNKRRRICLSGGEWDRNPPKCVAISKPAFCTIPKVGDAVRTWPKGKTTFEPSSAVWYNCASGYELDSPRRKRFCLKNGQWNRSPPNCIERSCIRPNSPEFGSFRPNRASYKIGQEIWFSCNEGYEISGAADITCKSTGKRTRWSAREPTCVPTYVQTCSPPVIPAYGSCRPEKQEYNVDDEIWFSCDTGYQIEGEADIICSSNENGSPTWSASAPTCIVPTCSMPAKPEFGSFSPVEGPYEIGAVVFFSCDEGYALSGIIDAVCVASSDTPPQWSGYEPTCLPQRTTCIVPTDPEFGSYLPIQTSYEIGNEIWFTCEDGYEIAGVQDLTCVENPGSSPNWSAQEPLCVPIIVITCPTPISPPNGSFLPNGGDYQIADVVWFMCDYGYEIEGIADITCIPSGTDVLPPTWSTPFPTCVMVEGCFPPELPSYGSYSLIDSLYEVGDDITFTCDSGYEIDGNSILICLENSGNPPVWSSAIPTCVPIVQECSAPMTPQNGYFGPIKASYVLEEFVWFSCDLGYILAGEKDIVCTENGGDKPFWSASEPTCVKVTTCQPPAPVQYGSFRPSKSTYGIGEEIWYSCDEGYEIQGVPDITCVDVENGFPKWSETEIICTEKIVVCSAPLAPAFGIVFPDLEIFQIGDVAIFECTTENYVLDGSAEATCLSDGTWDLPVPVCKLQQVVTGSCFGKCHLYADNSLSCKCDIHCQKAGTCCPDYKQYCH